MTQEASRWQKLSCSALELILAMGGGPRSLPTFKRQFAASGIIYIMPVIPMVWLSAAGSRLRTNKLFRRENSKVTSHEGKMLTLFENTGQMLPKRIPKSCQELAPKSGYRSLIRR
jgi:hypothetical protein